MCEALRGDNDLSARTLDARMPATPRSAEGGPTRAGRRTTSLRPPCSTRPSRRASPERRVPAFLPDAARGPHRRGRRGQGFRRDGQAVEAHWPGGSRASSSPATATLSPASRSRSSRPRTRCPTRAANWPPARILEMVRGLSQTTSCWPDLGRRLRADALPAEGLTLADKQASQCGAASSPAPRSAR